MPDWLNEFLRKIEAGDVGAIIFAVLAAAVIRDLIR
jgi:hypothetical protein